MHAVGKIAICERRWNAGTKEEGATEMLATQDIFDPAIGNKPEECDENIESEGKS